MMLRGMKARFLPLLIAIALLPALPACGRGPNPTAASGFAFAVVSDTHIGRNAGAGNNMEEAVAEINDSAAEFTLFLGDLVEDGNQETDCVQWRRTADGLRAPRHAVPGNHDALRGYTKHVRPETDFAFDHKGVRFICFNNSGPSRSRFEVTAAQVAWIRGQLEEAGQKGLRVALAAHFPWPMRDAKDPATAELQKVIEAHRENIALFLAGHLHVGLRGVEETPGIQVVVAPSTSYNRDPSPRNAPGWGVAEYRPAWLLVEFRDDKIILTCRPIGAAASGTHELSVQADRNAPVVR